MTSGDKLLRARERFDRDARAALTGLPVREALAIVRAASGRCCGADYRTVAEWTEEAEALRRAIDAAILEVFEPGGFATGQVDRWMQELEDALAADTLAGPGEF